jgi:H+/Cl- antiporter ClcA
LNCKVLLDNVKKEDMPQENTTKTLPLEPAALIKRTILGAAIALALIAFFLYSVKHPNPEWPKYWMIRPLLIVPIAGAAGGAISYLLNRMLYKTDGQKAIAIILGFIIYVIGLWMGAVLGLDGTLWD